MNLQERTLRLAWGLSGEKALLKLAPYVGKPGVYIRYVSGRFIGPNPKYRWFNPLAVYGFFCTAKHIPVKGLADRLPDYCSSFERAPYAYVFSVRTPEKMLDCATYRKVDLEQDMQKLLDMYPGKLTAKRMRSIAKHFGFRSPVTSLAEVISMCAKEAVGGKSPASMRSMYEKLGYAGIVDAQGKYNEDTPQQVLVFRKADVVPLLKMRNPLCKKWSKP